MLVVDGIAPIKTARLKQRSDPWMDNTILLAIRDRDNVLKFFKKLKSPENQKIYCHLRNKVQYKFRKAKQFFFKNKMVQCRNSSSDLWKTLKKLGISKKTVSCQQHWTRH